MKRIGSILLSMVLVCTCILPAMAYSTTQQNTADALYSLSLFLGYGKDADGKPVYELDNALTRAEGLTLLLRLLGKEETVQAGNYTHPFTDTAEWYDKTVGYAYETGLAKGTGATTFSGDEPMSGKMFAVFCLRALGYQDGTDFTWDNAETFARSLNFPLTDGNFTRGDTVELFWFVLNSQQKDSTQTLAEALIADGVFTAASFAAAKDIQSGTDSGSSSDSSTGGSSGGGSSSSGNRRSSDSASSTDPVPAGESSKTELPEILIPD